MYIHLDAFNLSTRNVYAGGKSIVYSCYVNLLQKTRRLQVYSDLAQKELLAVEINCNVAKRKLNYITSVLPRKIEHLEKILPVLFYVIACVFALIAHSTDTKLFVLIAKFGVLLMGLLKCCEV